MFINRTQKRPKRLISFQLSVVAVPRRGDGSEGHLSESSSHSSRVVTLWFPYCDTELFFFLEEVKL